MPCKAFRKLSGHTSPLPGGAANAANATRLLRSSRESALHGYLLEQSLADSPHNRNFKRVGRCRSVLSPFVRVLLFSLRDRRTRPGGKRLPNGGVEVSSINRDKKKPVKISLNGL
jgi:hypothetical protein